MAKFECRSCGHTFERSFGFDPEGQPCPVCEATVLREIPTAGAGEGADDQDLLAEILLELREIRKTLQELKP